MISSGLTEFLRTTPKPEKQTAAVARPPRPMNDSVAAMITNEHWKSILESPLQYCGQSAKLNTGRPGKLTTAVPHSRLWRNRTALRSGSVFDSSPFEAE